MELSDMVVRRIIRRAQYDALKAVAEAVSRAGERGWDSFAVEDVYKIVNDVTRNLGVDEQLRPGGPQ